MKTLTKPPADLRSLISSEKMVKQYERVLPKTLPPDRFVRIALTAITRTPKLLRCDQASFMLALMRCAELGIEPDGYRAHLIPFDNRKRGTVECQLIIDYKGIGDLILRDRNVESIHADVVCKEDEFIYNKGQIERHVIHFDKPRTEPYAAYSIIRFRGGGERSEVMSKEAILSIRDESQGWKAFKAGYAKQTPWDPRHPHIEQEMWKKTTLRRASKWVSLSPLAREVLAVDNLDYGYSSPPSAAPAPAPHACNITPEPPSFPPPDDGGSGENKPKPSSSTEKGEAQKKTSGKKTSGKKGSPKEKPTDDGNAVPVGEEDGGESLSALILEGRKILKDEKFLPLVKEVAPDAKKLSDLTTEQKEELLRKVNAAVDEADNE